MLRDGVRRDLLAPEVVGEREIRLAERAPELGDVGAHLLPRAVHREVAAQHVLKGLPDDPLYELLRCSRSRGVCRSATPSLS